jgi:predicted ArsR family transcriptional regulator
MKNWTFVTSHGAVLLSITRHSAIRALDIALEIGLTERSVRRIIADLVAAEYIEKNREGGINRYKLNPNMPLRRPEIQDKRVRDLIELCSSNVK